MTEDAQDTLWQFVESIGPGIWLMKPSFCLVAFIIMVVRAPPVSWLERVARYICFIGMLLIIFSVLNAPLAPFGDAIFFMGYTLTLAYKRLVEVSRGVVRPYRKRNGFEDDLAVMLGVWKDNR